MKTKTQIKQTVVCAVPKREMTNLRNQAALHLLAAMVSNPKSEGWTNVEMVNDSVLLANLFISALGTNK